MDRDTDERDSERYSVKEFAEYSGVSRSILRYYDRIGLFRPAGRGENSYRYYRASQIVSLHRIGVLTGLDTPLKDICALAGRRSPETVLRMLARQQRIIDRKMRRLQESQQIAHIYRDIIWHAMNARTDDVDVRELKEIRLFTADLDGPDDDEDGFYYGLDRFVKASARAAVADTAYPIGGMYGCIEEFVAHPSQPTGYYSICPRGPDKAGAGTYITGYARGGYGEFGDLPARMAAYAMEHRLRFTGPVYVMYILDEICMDNPKDYLARAFAQVTARRL